MPRFFGLLDENCLKIQKGQEVSVDRPHCKSVGVGSIHNLFIFNNFGVKISLALKVILTYISIRSEICELKTIVEA